MPLPPIEAGLTLDQLQRSEQSEKTGKYANVKAEEVFAQGSNSALAAQFFNENPVRYRKLRRQYQISLHELFGDALTGE